MSHSFFGAQGFERNNKPCKAILEADQVSALHELGLLSGGSSGKRGKSVNRDYSAQAGLPEPGFRKNKPIAAGSAHLFHRKSSASTGSAHSKSSALSGELKQRSGGGMSGMLDVQRSRTRRERTFVGSECAVCEEPLENTLAGERVLQFSCGHVSHGACFYEYITEFESQYCPSCNAPLGLDTSRGGNVLDISKLSSITRSSESTRAASTPTPTPWDDQTTRSASIDVADPPHLRDSASRENGALGASISSESRDRDSHRYAPPSRTTHTRSDSDATGGHVSSNGYPETAVSSPNINGRLDYDVQAMDMSIMNPKATTPRNPIPPPQVTIRSEFPTLNRSRQQQTLTCLITIEVPDNKWMPDDDDLISASPGLPTLPEETFARPPSPAISAPRFFPYESPEVLEEITENLRLRVENWHGLDFSRFGKLRLYGTIKVGKDKRAWQELECFLFAEMLICVKEKKTTAAQHWDDQGPVRKNTRCTLKGSILIKKHLNSVTQSSVGKDQLGMTQRITASNLRPMDESVLTLSLSVAELPQFHLMFENFNQLKLWQQALLDLNAVESPLQTPDYERTSDADDEDWHRVRQPHRDPSMHSSYGGGRASGVTSRAEHTSHMKHVHLPQAVHVPVDIVVVVPISSSMQGVKITLVRDALKFLVANLGDRDRMGLVTFGSGGGSVPLVGLTSKTWSGWANILTSIKPMGQKSHRSDVVEGANVAMDLLMQRKINNPIATILLISDSSTSDNENVDFVVSRAEAAKIAIHSFGLGTTHKPDTMIELSTRTKASYTYVKDWMMLRECLAGCLGALQTMSHQNVRLMLRLPEGSPAKFVKISGALQITKRAAGKDAEAALGDLRFGDKRDILVQLVISPDAASEDTMPQDPWESIVSGLEALGGPIDMEDQRAQSIEEVPLVQADLTWGNILRDGTLSHLPRPSLLAITMLPAATPNPSRKSNWPATPPIPPHPLVVQRRMELLTSDMLTRALTLVSRGQHDRAQHLLNETRSILKGLGKGGLPPIPQPSSHKSHSPNPQASGRSTEASSPTSSNPSDTRRSPSPSASFAPSAMSRNKSNDAMGALTPAVDAAIVAALDAELESSLEWINHPAVFGRDSRKAVLQAIGVISSQRGYTFRTPIEELWATRVGGVKKLMAKSREWREEGGGEGGIMEES